MFGRCMVPILTHMLDQERHAVWASPLSLISSADMALIFNPPAAIRRRPQLVVCQTMSEPRLQPSKCYQNEALKMSIRNDKNKEMLN